MQCQYWNGIHIAINANHIWLHLYFADLTEWGKIGKNYQPLKSHQALLHNQCHLYIIFTFNFKFHSHFTLLGHPQNHTFISPTDTLQAFSLLFTTPQWSRLLFLKHHNQLTTLCKWTLTASEDWYTRVGFNSLNFKCLQWVCKHSGCLTHTHTPTTATGELSTQRNIDSNSSDHMKMLTVGWTKLLFQLHWLREHPPLNLSRVLFWIAWNIPAGWETQCRTEKLSSRNYVTSSDQLEYLKVHQSSWSSNSLPPKSTVRQDTKTSSAGRRGFWVPGEDDIIMAPWR